MKNTPKQGPDASARPISAGVTGVWQPPERLTRPTATTAQPTPISASGPGTLSVNRPKINGTTAAVTAVTGAKIDIAPRERPWYSRTMPTTPASPAPAPHNTVVQLHKPPNIATHPARTGRQATWDSTVTAKALARCVAFPPQKSPVPQTKALSAARRAGSTSIGSL